MARKGNGAHTGPLSASDLIPVIDGLTDMLKLRYFDAVDLVLRTFPVAVAPAEVLVALLRTTFPLRGTALRSWASLLSRVRTELDKRHVDTLRVLRGLI